MSLRPTTGTSRCVECGFDPGRWRRRDVATLFEAAPWWWTEALTELGSGQDAVRREVVALRDGALGLVEGLAEGWLGEAMAPADEFLLDAAHHFRHLTMQASDAIQALRAAGPRTARVVQINTSGGGVPKQPVAKVEVDWDGLIGDRQADSKHHGRPFQAVCLWSAEVIEDLAREGHPIGPGWAGENLTVSGLPWAQIRPGALLSAGSCRLEISYPAVPCHKQSRWFSDGDFNRISHDDHPGWARWYAWVRQPGTVTAGDAMAWGS